MDAIFRYVNKNSFFPGASPKLKVKALKKANIGTTIYVIVILSGIAGAIKIIGGLVFGSKSLLVDALTSLANVLAIVATVIYYRRSMIPPDRDHHFGHYRLAFGGTIVTLMAYSFVAGVAVLELLEITPYDVGFGAPVLASAGFVIYLVVIILARRIGQTFGAYSLLTVSELIESAVVIASSLAGALYSYIIDYAGAVVLTTYIFFELVDISRDVILRLSDIAPNPEIEELIRREFEEAGLDLGKLRLRYLDYRRLHGDAVVVVKDKNERVGELLKNINSVKQKVLRKYDVDLSVELENK